MKMSKSIPPNDESTERENYTRELEKTAYSAFPRTYLNVPTCDSKFYFENFWKFIWHGFTYSGFAKRL